MTLLPELMLAHFAGDFLLQSHAMVKEKEEKKLRSKYLYLHAFIHFILILLIAWDLHVYKIALAVAGTHFAIDLAKVSLQNEKKRRAWFYIDQLLHLVSIVVIWALFTGYDYSGFLEKIHDQHTVLFLLAVVMLTTPASAFVKIFISRWTPADNKHAALSDAGKYIGILERLLAFAFIITNHWSALGFLITAKSVFRFGDLKQAGDRELTEYILIGTLVSFGIAVLTAMVYLLVLPGIK